MVAWARPLGLFSRRLLGPFSRGEWVRFAPRWSLGPFSRRRPAAREMGSSSPGRSPQVVAVIPIRGGDWIRFAPLVVGFVSGAGPVGPFFGAALASFSAGH